MKLLTSASMLFLPFALATSIAAQQLPRSPRSVSVPTLQEAIYRASPGDVLYADFYAPRIKQGIYVDRPLTLVGGSYVAAPAIQAFGPGYGTLKIVGAEILDARTVDPNYSAYAATAVTAVGFEEVRFESCYVEATSVRAFDDYGHSAVVASTPKLVVIRSEFRASAGVTNFPDYTCGSVMGEGPAAVQAGAVTAIDSVFVGGAGIRYCFDDYSGMCGSAPSYTDAGGAGLFAHTLSATRCTFVGGAGCSWKNRPEVGPTGAPYILQ